MSVLDNLRNTIAYRISLNPHELICDIYPTIVNSDGYTVADITKEAVPTSFGFVTISRRLLPEPVITNAKTPYDYNDQYYMIAPYNITGLTKGLMFNYNGERFRTKLPEAKRLFGGIAYYVCDLEQITSRHIGAY